MSENEINYQELLDFSITLGKLLLSYEAEIYRVEESIRRVLSAYGCSDISVFAIPSFLVITIHDSNGNPITQSVRIYQRSINLSRIDQLNNLTRKVSDCAPPLPEAYEALKRIEHIPTYPHILRFLMAGLVGFAFTMFFGGGLRDGLCGILCGIAIGVSSHYLSVFQVNPYFSIGLSSALSALIALISVKLGIGQHMDVITTGALMNLVPGVALTNSVRDAIGEDLIAGLLRLAQVLIISLSIALGVGMIIAAFG